MINNAVDGLLRYRRHHFQFDEQWKMIGKDVWMGTADDFVLFQPFGAMRPEQTQRRHTLFRVENIIDDTL